MKKRGTEVSLFSFSSILTTNKTKTGGKQYDNNLFKA